MQIWLWRGYHSEHVRQLVDRAWASSEILLILCPPSLKDFGFVSLLPAGTISWIGDWTNTEIENASHAVRNRSPEYPVLPVLGLFTTGTSSGQPRMILYSHDNIRASLKGILSFFSVERIDSIFCYPQPFHTFGLLLGYILALERDWAFYSGVGRYNTEFHRARLQNRSAGLLTLGTPTHFQDLMTYVIASGAEIAPSYSAIIGGAQVSKTLWHRLQDELHISHPSIGYGATEASPGVSHLPAGQAPRELGEVGYPIPGLKIDLIPGQGYEFSGPSMCTAIVHAQRIEFPTAVFIADELRGLPDGSLVFCGRSDLVLNRGGEKLFLESIEECLRSSQFRMEILAVGVPHARLGFELGLLFAGQMNEEISFQVCAILQLRFAIKFDPTYFCEVQSLPVGANQKPDRRLGLKLLLDHLQRQVNGQDDVQA